MFKQIKTHVKTMGLIVSTVDLNSRFLGASSIYGDRYETMVFRCDENGKVTDWLELYCDRYSSVALATEGHYNAVCKCEDGEIFDRRIAG